MIKPSVQSRLTLLLAAVMALSFRATEVRMQITSSFTLDSLGAAQGVSYQGNRIFAYGDREIGVIREYSLQGNVPVYQQREMKLTERGKDVINHPTGIAHNGTGPTFIGNSIRLNPEGTAWKAVIYCVNWEGLRRQGTLDGNLIRAIEDDACIQGTRPEYVQYQGRWYVATADYGNKGNEVRLYDPAALEKATRTSEKGVLYKKFTCGPWVQNLHWVPEKGLLVLVQNQIEGKQWRFTWLDLEKSVQSGKAQVVQAVDLGNADELEGFALLNPTQGIAITSSAQENAHLMRVDF